MRFRKVAGFAALAFALTATVAAAAPSFPATIALPSGFQPEGIAIRGTTFYVGSIPTGAVRRGNVRTGVTQPLVEGALPNTGKAAIGIAVDNRSRLFVAGGNTGKAFVYNARTGSTIATYTLTTEASFVNDVVVTRTGAYFTDSVRQVLYRIPFGAGGALGSTAQTIPLTGDLVYETGFNANGIDATPNGRWLVVVQSNTGELFRVDPRSGAANEIELANGESVPMGDGILLDGRTLYVVQNRLNRLAVIAVDRALTSGRVVTRLADTRFSVPTTLDELGRRLYLVNARFGEDPATADYEVLQVRKPRGR
jgi:sugar lactone lactonase YvrE